MDHKTLPKLNAEEFKSEFNHIDDKVFDRWREMNFRAEGDDDDNVITIFETIGQDFFGEGFTARKLHTALKAIGNENDVIVSINSPGGSFFEGMAIYNLLVQHEGNVTVRIPGIAASSASLIAMAGDDIQIAESGFMMIHAVWGIVMGNQHDLRDLSETFEKFDNAIADVYHARSGFDRDEIAKMLTKDTFMSGNEAVEKGFADSVMPAKTVKKNEKDKDKKAKALARRTIENSLAANGYKRSQREEIFKQALDGRDAVQDPTRDAGYSEDELNSLLNVITED